MLLLLERRVVDQVAIFASASDRSVKLFRRPKPLAIPQRMAAWYKSCSNTAAECADADPRISRRFNAVHPSFHLQTSLPALWAVGRADESRSESYARSMIDSEASPNRQESPAIRSVLHKSPPNKRAAPLGEEQPFDVRHV